MFDFTNKPDWYVEQTSNFEDDAKRRTGDMESIPEYPQDKEANEYRYLSPAWLNAIAEGLTSGAEKHPGETWREIPADEHLARALRHINLYRMGDRNEPHIINASMRVMMAFEVSQAESEGPLPLDDWDSFKHKINPDLEETA